VRNTIRIPIELLAQATPSRSICRSWAVRARALTKLLWAGAVGKPFVAPA
jgi:hypothetical protein